MFWSVFALIGVATFMFPRLQISPFASLSFLRLIPLISPPRLSHFPASYLLFSLPVSVSPSHLSHSFFFPFICVESQTDH